MSTRDKIPVTIVTGFLGSGKTTLLQHVLAGESGLRIGVLVNELGSLGVDGTLLQGKAQRMIELSNGCICCSINGDLRDAAVELLDQGELDWVIVETTGVADPYPVAITFRLPELRSRTRIDCIVCMLDATATDTARLASDTALNQVAYSDVLVVNKVDLADPSQVDEALWRLRLAKPDARILTATFGGIPSGMLDWGRAHDLAIDRPLPLEGYRAAREPAHDIGGLRTVAFETKGALDARAVQRFLSALPVGVLRAKGWFDLGPSLGRHVFHVCGTRLSVEASPGGDGGHRWVFIGKDVDEKQLMNGASSCSLSLAQESVHV